MRKLLGLSFVVLATASLLLIGCGDDGESETVSLSKAAFVRKATAVCEKASERILNENSAALEEEREGSGRSDEELVLDLLVPGVEREIEEVRALGAPKVGEDEVDAILDELQEVMDEAKANPEKFLQDLGAGRRPYQDVEKLASEYGIMKCAQP